MRENPDKTCFEEPQLEEINLRAAEPDCESVQPADKKDTAGASEKKENVPALNGDTNVINEAPLHEYDSPEVEKLKLAKVPYHGMLRHRIIVGGCLAFAATIVAMSAVDLRQLVSHKVTVSPSFQVSPIPNPPELPTNLSFPTLNNGTVSPSNDGLRQVVESNWDYDRYGFVNDKGKVVIKPRFGQVTDFHSGLAGFRPPDTHKHTGSQDYSDANTEPWGFINTKGKIVIHSQFTEIGQFRGDVAAARTEEFGGLIDKSGHFVVKSKAPGLPTDYVHFFGVSDQGKTHLYDHHGKKMGEYDQVQALQRNDGYHPYGNLNLDQTNGYIRNAETPTNNPGQTFFKFQSKGKWGLIDGTGKELIPPVLSEIFSYNNGLAIVVEGGKYGMVNATGKNVIAPEFDYMTDPADLIAASKQKQWILMDSSGNVLKNTQPFDEPILSTKGEWFSDGLGPVLIKGKVGYINVKGQLAIQPTFEFGTMFKEGAAAVWDGSYWRYINKLGQFIKTGAGTRFESITLFNNGTSTAGVPGPLFFLQHPRVTDEVNSVLDNWKKKTN